MCGGCVSLTGDALDFFASVMHDERVPITAFPTAMQRRVREARAQVILDKGNTGGLPSDATATNRA